MKSHTVSNQQSDMWCSRCLIFYSFGRQRKAIYLIIKALKSSLLVWNPPPITSPKTSSKKTTESYLYVPVEKFPAQFPQRHATLGNTIQTSQQRWVGSVPNHVMRHADSQGRKVVTQCMTNYYLPFNDLQNLNTIFYILVNIAN